MPAGIGARKTSIVLRFGGIQPGPACGTMLQRTGGQALTAVGHSAPADIPTGTYAIVDNGGTLVVYQGDGVHWIERTTSAGGFTAGAVSTAGFAGDFVLRLKMLAFVGASIVGMNSDPLTDNDFGGIEHAWEPTFGQIYENGLIATSPGTTPTYYWIWRVGTNLSYGRGATLPDAMAAPDRTVVTSATLYFDSSFAGDGDKVEVLLMDMPQILQPAVFTNTPAFFGPTATSTANVAPGLVTDADTFFAPMVTPGAVTLTPGLVTDADTFRTHVLTSLATLSPALVTDADTFHSPTVTSSKTLSPALYANAPAFYVPTVSTSYALIPPLVTDADTFHAPTVTTSYALQAPLTVNGQVFYGPTVSQTGSSQNLTATRVVNAQAFYVPQVLSTAGGGGGSSPRVSAFFFR